MLVIIEFCLIGIWKPKQLSSTKYCSAQDYTNFNLAQVTKFSSVMAFASEVFGQCGIVHVWECQNDQHHYFEALTRLCYS